MLRVVLVGDSQLTDTSPRRRSVTKLGPRLRLRGHEVETLATGGLDTRSALASIRSIPRADWTVFCFGANDAAPWKRVAPDDFDVNYETLVRRANSANILILGPAPVADSELPGERNNRDVARYSAIAAQIAIRCEVSFIPLFDLLSSAHLADDGVHLSHDGYDTLERLVSDTIEPPRTSDTNGR